MGPSWARRSGASQSPLTRVRTPIEASAPGRKPWSQTVVVADGATTARVTVADSRRSPSSKKSSRLRRLRWTVPPLPVDVPSESAHASGLKVAAVVVGGLGVVGVGLGTAFGLISRGDHDDAANACPPPGPCANASGADLWRNAYHFGNASTVAFVIGGVGLAAGTVMWVVAVKTTKHKDASAELVVGPGSVGWRGVW